MKRERRKFSHEFKMEAVRQITEQGRPASQVARDLDLRPEQLRLWKKLLLESGEVPSPNRIESTDEELRRVKRELEVMRQERDFLKKATVDSMGERIKAGIVGGLMLAVPVTVVFAMLSNEAESDDQIDSQALLEPSNRIISSPRR